MVAAATVAICAAGSRLGEDEAGAQAAKVSEKMSEIKAARVERFTVCS